MPKENGQKRSPGEALTLQWFLVVLRRQPRMLDKVVEVLRSVAAADTDVGDAIDEIQDLARQNAA